MERYVPTADHSEDPLVAKNLIYNAVREIRAMLSGVEEAVPLNASLRSHQSTIATSITSGISLTDQPSSPSTAHTEDDLWTPASAAAPDVRNTPLGSSVSQLFVTIEQAGGSTDSLNEEKHQQNHPNKELLSDGEWSEASEGADLDGDEEGGRYPQRTLIHNNSIHPWLAQTDCANWQAFQLLHIAE